MAVHTFVVIAPARPAPCVKPPELITPTYAISFFPAPTHLPQVVLPRSDGTTRTVSVLDMADQLDAQKETIDELGQSVQAAMLAIKQLQNQDVAFKAKMAIDDSEEEVCTHTTSCVSLFFWVLLSCLFRTTVRIYLHPPHSNPFTFIGMLTCALF